MQWPSQVGLDPDLSATPNTVRFSGGDRYQTNLAMGLGLRGAGGAPFETSDLTSANAPTLAAANRWFGAATCPRSILVVAGDTFADALAAASLSDPLDRSEQPRLTRVAAADPVFDAVGGVDRPDTAFAPIVVTQSARSGATRLSPTARATAADLAAGGCTSAREAVIVGGTGAIATGVERELVGLGFREVFRVAGVDRYDTAAKVAEALGTGTPTASVCADPESTDGTTDSSYYGNAVAEFRLDASSCRLLPRSVVLADGATGADALAAGWWTSQWQVPVLLTAPDGSLPPATRRALSELSIDSLIVLGGTARIPEPTVDEARQLASAAAGRVAGDDRYATSVAMAERFGGWNPTTSPPSSAGDLFCVAASSGSGDAAVGWPDALAAGPLCGRFGAIRAGAPPRALAPADATGSSALLASRVPPAHAAVPILLVPHGASALPAPVAALLGEHFVGGGGWCLGTSAPAGCLRPGFGILFGGIVAVPTSVAGEVTGLVEGQPNTLLPFPSLERPFATRLDLGPVFTAAADGSKVCVAAGDVRAARWLSVTDRPDGTGFVGESDLVAGRIYRGSRSTGVCTPLRAAGGSLTAVGVDGTRSATTSFDPSDAQAVSLSGPVQQLAIVSEDNGGQSWTSAGPGGTTQLRSNGRSALITGATLDLELRVTGSTAAVTGSVTIESPGQAVAGSITADAQLVGGVWEVRGRVVLGSLGDGRLSSGGFTASLGATGGATGTARWQLDATPSA